MKVTVWWWLRISKVQSASHPHRTQQTQLK